MISNRPDVSAYQGTPPAEGDDRTIPGGPLYALGEVQALARSERLAFWSAGAIRDAEKWELDTADAARLVERAVQQGRYQGAQWCIQKPNGPWAACDAYTITVEEWVEAAHRSMPTTYYLKFCIARTGEMLLLVSNHPEGA